ncbi:hypothetical protein ABT009_46680 [Streptomyces sp. NPDC002896]|uniref:hypothetical protein n=1 Tax=Streptomyces sp. NPDC002896 TaxID=3154438 RepID=UPI00332703DE
MATWLSWWFTSYDFDAAQVLTYLACIFSAAALYRVVPCAVRLGGAFRPRLRTPSTWLPPTRTALAAAALLLVYGLIGGDSSSRSGSLKADSDLLRDRGLSAFLNYVGQNSSRPSFGDILIGLLALLFAAGCVWFGLQAGRTAVRRWEETHRPRPAGRPPPHWPSVSCPRGRRRNEADLLMIHLEVDEERGLLQRAIVSRGTIVAT